MPRYEASMWTSSNIWWVMDREHPNDNGTTGRVVPGSVLSGDNAEFEVRVIAAVLNALRCRN